MTERIKILTKKTLNGEMGARAKKTEYDRCDLFLSTVKKSGKRVCEYIINQDVFLLEESAFTGLLSFDGSVEGDIFNRSGHANFNMLARGFYNKPVDNLMTFEWQHSVGDFKKIINGGIDKVLCDIEKSMEKHKGDDDKTEFLETQKDICYAILKRAEKASEEAEKLSNQAKKEEYKFNLKRLSQKLKNVPQKPAQSFYEAVLCLYFVYPYIPDSIGLIDRYLYPYYKSDIEKGELTDAQAKEYLQELFLMLQARIGRNSNRFYRGGESHFCIGGYLENGEDGFNELSKLVVDALMELPTWIPQISLRWTKKTPDEVFKYMLDCERKDKNKRIAFVNDEPRINGLMKYTGVTYKEAVNYTMMGCNELALPGGMVLGFDPMNVARSIENVFFKREKDAQNTKSFEEFYAIFEEELFSDLWQADKIGKGMQDVRAKDCNLVSNIFLEGPVQNAKSCTQGGLTRYIAVGDLIGITTVIDSLSIVKQFVFDEKITTMAELIEALHNNWQGFEDLRTLILKKGAFFGNDDSCSNFVAQKFTKSLEKWNNTENYLHKKWVFGNLIGYNEHHKFFGNALKATPDGRFEGENITFGIGQMKGKDRNGLSALLNSIAKCDPENVLTGPSVTNILIDETLIFNDDNFEKLSDLLLTYFKMGGTHFQLTYVNKEDLINAQKTPEEYKNLRVRVSGFSDYFIFLNEALQEDIIDRTKISE